MQLAKEIMKEIDSQMENVTLNLYDVKEVGEDFVVLTDTITYVKITFADVEPRTEGELPPTKKEQAGLLKGILCQVGLEAPIVSVNEPKTVNLFMDHKYEFGMLRSTPFPYRVARIEISRIE